MGDLRAVAAGCAERDRSRRCRRRSGPPDRPAGHASGDPHRAGALGAPAAARHGSRPRAPCARSHVLGHQRRGHPGRRGPALRGGPAGGDAGESLRIVGSRRRCLRLRRHRRRRSRAHPDRPADRQHAPLRPRRARHPAPIGVAGEIHVGGVGLARGLPARRRAHGAEVRAAIRSPGMRGRGSIGPATWGGSCPTATWNTSGAWTTRSSCAACASSWARSRACCVRTRRSTPRWPSSPQAGGDDARLIAYVVAGARRPEASELRRFVRERLPDHAVPARVRLPRRAADDAQRQARSARAPVAGADPGRGRAHLRRPRGRRPKTPWPGSWPRCSRWIAWAFTTISSSSGGTPSSPSR